MANNDCIVKDLHIGNAIADWMKKNNLSQNKLAEILGMPQPSLSRTLKQKTIDTIKLANISLKLKYNFFSLYADPDNSSNEITSENPIPVSHIGKNIWIKMKENHISNKELASLLGVDSSTVSKILKKESIDTGKLVEISNLLEYNFFGDYFKPISRAGNTFAEQLGFKFSPINDIIATPITLSIDKLEKLHIIASETGMSMEEVLAIGLNSVFHNHMDEIISELKKNKGK
ncbi:MAG: helix-turn-helix domain-containing protein [bacterium P3]|nr:MAG: helix-turn-helix domain-containing protein [bacterium P3]KWW34433.1 MAG: helix-turn-helix domain-containing protein [bacterium F083]